MPTVDYLPVATNIGANVEPQADFDSASYRGNGFSNGIAQPSQANKMWRQSSVMAAALANFISASLGSDVLDDGDVAALQAKLTSAIKTNAGGTTAPALPASIPLGPWIIKIAIGTTDPANSSTTTPADATQTVAWGTDFPTACLAAFVSMDLGTNSNHANWWYQTAGWTIHGVTVRRQRDFNDAGREGYFEGSTTRPIVIGFGY